MNTKTTSIGDFDSIDVEDTTHAAVIMFSQLTQSMNAGFKGLAKLVHRHGLSIQGRYTPEELVTRKTSIKNEFISTWKKEQDWILSESAGEHRLDSKQCKALDQAIWKIAATLGFGGNLDELDTTSKCERFNKEENAKKAAALATKELKHEAEEVAKGEGLAVGTKPFNTRVKQYVRENSAERGKEALLSTMEVFGMKVAKKLTELEEAGICSKELNDVMVHIELVLDKKIEAALAASDVNVMLQEAG